MDASEQVTAAAQLICLCGETTTYFRVTVTSSLTVSIVYVSSPAHT